MAGYEVVKVATDERGGIDVDDLRAKADDDVACLMLTNPNTLGLFDERIEEIAEIVHGTGATLYYDGANLNAVMGISRPGDMGFDIVHVNLHKSFSQPHGGGGPGRRADRGVGPHRAVPAAPAGRAPRGRRTAAEPHFDLDYDRPEVDRPAARLPGQLRRVRALLRLHPQPRRRRPARGVRDRGAERQLPARAACARGAPASTCRSPSTARCKHEFVLSGARAKRELGVKTLDIAKRLLDYGFHPPTVYFPLLVDEALMVEPTETEAQGDARRVRRRGRGDPGRGRAGPGDRAQRAVHDAGAAARRGRRDEAAGGAPAAVAPCASEDVEAVRRGYEAWNRGDVGAVLELVDPDIEWRPGADAPEAGEHRGRDGFRGFIESWLESFEDLQHRARRSCSSEGDRVVAMVRQRGRGRGSGVEIDVATVHVWRIRDGRAVGWYAYRNREDALAALRT